MYKCIEALLIILYSVRNAKYAYTCTCFPVFMKYPHELHKIWCLPCWNIDAKHTIWRNWPELGFHREDLLSLMHNLYMVKAFYVADII